MASSGQSNIKNLPVARLIRCRQTQRYFTGQGWSEDPARAEVFDDPLDAVRACLSHDLQNIEMVLRVNGSQVDLFSTTVR
jgi:hypothetical protein